MSPPDLATHVCRNCKQRKKRCDKTIPCCKLCQKLRIRCQYDEVYKASSERGELADLRLRLARIESHVIGSTTASKGSSKYASSRSSSPATMSIYSDVQSNTTTTSLSSLPSYLFWRPFQPNKYACTLEPDRFYEHVTSLLRGHGDTGTTPLDVCDTYFRTIHPWLPIIPRYTSYEALRHHANARKSSSLRSPSSASSMPAGISLLLLCMYLMTQIPAPTVLSSPTHHYDTASNKASPPCREDKDRSLQREDDHQKQQHQRQNTLYITTKHTWSLACTILPPCSEVVQAGLLIAAWEHSHGFLHEAYLSVGACVRMGNLLGLEGLVRTTGAGNWGLSRISEARSAEGRNIWWGCVMRETFLALENIFAGRMFTPPIIKPTDILPLDSCQLDSLTDPVSPPWATKGQSLIHIHPVSTGPEPHVLGFAREAQAIHLVCGVLELITADGPIEEGRRRDEVQRLNNILQSFLLLVMHQAAGTWGIYCGAMNITIGTLFVLHRWELSHYSQSIQKSLAAADYVSCLALTTLAKLAIDTSRAFNAATKDFDINALPVSSAYAVFQTGLFLVESGEGKQRGGQELDGSWPKHFSRDWVGDLEALRETLWHYSQRWRIAEDYLALLDKQTPVPVREFGQYTNPYGHLPGFC